MPGVLFRLILVCRFLTRVVVRLLIPGLFCLVGDIVQVVGILIPRLNGLGVWLGGDDIFFDRLEVPQGRVGQADDTVLERGNRIPHAVEVGDQVEAGQHLDAEVSKDLLLSIFLPQSPLHDGAVVIQQGRISYAGTILPLTLKTDLPEGVGTRHRAAVGITEETDAVVVVVSEETGSISVVMAGELAQNLPPPKLREVMTEILGSDRRDLPPSAHEAAQPLSPAAGGRQVGSGAATARSVG